MRGDVPPELGGRGADRHLDEAGRTGRGAGHLRADAYGAGDRCRQQQTIADADDDLGQENRGHLPAWERDIDQHVEQTADDGERDSPPNQSIDAEARGQPRHRKVAGHESDRGNEEPQAVFGRRVSQKCHHHVGRAAEKAEEWRRSEPRAQRVAEEARA